MTDTLAREWIERILLEELDRWGEPGNRFEDAAEVFRDATLEDDFPPFLTIPAYTRYLVDTVPAREPEAVAS